MNEKIRGETSGTEEVKFERLTSSVPVSDPVRTRESHNFRESVINKFKVGDRVRVIRVESGDHTKVGHRGTVISDDNTPWIVFDEPISYGYAARGYDSLWKKGYTGCAASSQLELALPETAGVTALYEEIKTLNFDITWALKRQANARGILEKLGHGDTSMSFLKICTTRLYARLVLVTAPTVLRTYYKRLREAQAQIEGFYPEITDGCERVENFKSCLAVLRRILGLWCRSMYSNTSALAASSVGYVMR